MDWTDSCVQRHRAGNTNITTDSELEKYTQNIHIHHLPPGGKIPVQQGVRGAESGIVDTDIHFTQVRMGFYPGEQRSNVLLLSQVTLPVIKLNKIYISRQQGISG